MENGLDGEILIFLIQMFSREKSFFLSSKIGKKIKNWFWITKVIGGQNSTCKSGKALS